MEQVSRKELLAAGGAPDAAYAVFYQDGSLYFCTRSEQAARDVSYWAEKYMTVKRVTEDQNGTEDQ